MKEGLHKTVEETRRGEYQEWILEEGITRTSWNRGLNYVGGDLVGITELCDEIATSNEEGSHWESFTLITRSGGEGADVGSLMSHEACWVLEDRLNDIRWTAMVEGRDEFEDVRKYLARQYEHWKSYMNYDPVDPAGNHDWSKPNRWEKGEGHAWDNAQA